jgi:drug/metabolite transporter (DMT)-like permease
MAVSKGIQNMLLATLLFTAANALVKSILHIPAAEIVMFRSIVSLASCWYLMRRANLYPWGKHRKLLVMRGLFGAVALICFFMSIQRLPLASALVLFYTTPMLSTVVAHWWLGEPFYRLQWLFFAISTAGILLIKGFDVRVDAVGLGLGLAASVSSAFAYNTIKRMKGLEDPIVIVFFFPLVTMPLTLPWVAWDWVTPQGLDWLVLGVVGVLTQTAQVAMTRGYQQETISRASSVTYLGVLYGLLVGYAFFGETFGWEALAGMALVVAGLLLHVNVVPLRQWWLERPRR